MLYPIKNTDHLKQVRIFLLLFVSGFTKLNNEIKKKKISLLPFIISLMSMALNGMGQITNNIPFSEVEPRIITDTVKWDTDDPAGSSRLCFLIIFYLLFFPDVLLAQNIATTFNQPVIKVDTSNPTADNK